METSFTFRNLESTSALKDHTLQKMGKVKKYLLKPISAHVIFSLDKFRHCVEINIIDNGIEYVGSEESPDMYQSIDRAIDKLVRQLKRKKERIKHHKTKD